MSTPSASGDQTTLEMSCSRQTSKTSPSGARHSIEYWGCEETNVTSDGAASRPARIWSGVHSLNPM